LAGFARFGICSESAMPYRTSYDASLAPSSQAFAAAHALLEHSQSALAVHWIVPWQSARSVFARAVG